ncbi:hypothetical protein [Blastococcus haudaquaticus]|uniref:Uncharacterized protein n=1 Tax=Blastococcus haudaquaticus TaxID=1938745 RepID=A0A286GGS7_9ACTN|nr:hypothetical protein [Blastococcus haudaquaticus]SOD94718.1 hypothetical protein SAMN06272739_0969 [Blastococcus haudaquaticus]
MRNRPLELVATARETGPVARWPGGPVRTDTAELTDGSAGQPDDHRFGSGSVPQL